MSNQARVRLSSRLGHDGAKSVFPEEITVEPLLGTVKDLDSLFESFQFLNDLQLVLFAVTCSEKCCKKLPMPLAEKVGIAHQAARLWIVSGNEDLAEDAFRCARDLNREVQDLHSGKSYFPRWADHVTSLVAAYNAAAAPGLSRCLMELAVSEAVRASYLASEEVSFSWVCGTLSDLLMTPDVSGRNFK